MCTREIGALCQDQDVQEVSLSRRLPSCRSSYKPHLPQVPANTLFTAARMTTRHCHLVSAWRQGDGSPSACAAKQTYERCLQRARAPGLKPLHNVNVEPKVVKTYAGNALKVASWDIVALRTSNAALRSQWSCHAELHLPTWRYLQPRSLRTIAPPGMWPTRARIPCMAEIYTFQDK